MSTRMNNYPSSRMNKWLESKFSGISDNFDDLYMTPDQQKFIGFNSCKYSDFYGDHDDIDVKNNPSYYPDAIKYCVSCDDDVINDDLQQILNFTEIYKTPHDTNVIIIYPSINRSHCNFLFKMLMSSVKQNKMNLSFSCVSNVVKNGNNNVVIKKLIFPIMSTDDKYNFYKFCFDNSTTPLNSFVNTQQDKKVITPYKNIPESVLKKMFYEINQEKNKYYEYIDKLWNYIIASYVNSEYKMILGRITDGLSRFIKFNEFMLSLPVYQTMIKIFDRLKVTLGDIVICESNSVSNDDEVFSDDKSSASESITEHTEISEQQSLE